MNPEITAKFASLQEKGEAALIAYVMAGDPDPETTPKIVEALVRGGADLIELGMPFSDPVADGPTIQAAGSRALAAGMNPERYFELVAGLKVKIPRICMSYYNLVFRFGPEAFVKKCKASGLSGLIVPDLPVQAAAELRKACQQHSLALIFLIAPTSPDKRIEPILSRTEGFVYLLSSLGVTGVREEIGNQAEGLLTRVKSDLPKAVGFGISTGAQAESLIRAGANAVIVGSAFVKLIASNTALNMDSTMALPPSSSTSPLKLEAIEKLEKELEALARELKTGIRKATASAVG